MEETFPLYGHIYLEIVYLHKMSLTGAGWSCICRVDLGELSGLSPRGWQMMARLSCWSQPGSEQNTEPASCSNKLVSIGVIFFRLDQKRPSLCDSSYHQSQADWSGGGLLFALVRLSICIMEGFCAVWTIIIPIFLQVKDSCIHVLKWYCRRGKVTYSEN